MAIDNYNVDKCNLLFFSSFRQYEWKSTVFNKNDIRNVGAIEMPFVDDQTFHDL